MSVRSHRASSSTSRARSRAILDCATRERRTHLELLVVEPLVADDAGRDERQDVDLVTLLADHALASRLARLAASMNSRVSPHLDRGQRRGEGEEDARLGLALALGARTRDDDLDAASSCALRRRRRIESVLGAVEVGEGHLCRRLRDVDLVPGLLVIIIVVVVAVVGQVVVAVGSRVRRGGGREREAGGRGRGTRLGGAAVRGRGGGASVGGRRAVVHARSGASWSRWSEEEDAVIAGRLDEIKV